MKYALPVFAVILAAALICSSAFGQAKGKNGGIFDRCCPLSEDPEKALQEAKARGCAVLLGLPKRG